MRRRAILLMATIVAAVLLASGVAIAESVLCDSTPPCYGTPEDDQITGTDNGETIRALGGSDDVLAGGGVDTIYGEDGDDYVEGNAGNDTIYGGLGKDVMYGYEDSDTIYGNGGNDFISTSSPFPSEVDDAYGGGGNDTFEAADGQVDHINCGKGTDTVSYDQGLDTIKGCENKNAV